MCACMSTHGLLWTQNEVIAWASAEEITFLFKWAIAGESIQHISAEVQNLIRLVVIHWKLSEAHVHLIPLVIHVTQTFSLVCSRVLQWSLGGQMDMESKLDTTWQQLLWWRQDARLRSFQRWTVKLNSIWHCVVSVRTSALHSRCLELLNVLLSCKMHVRMLMRNEFF